MGVYVHKCERCGKEKNLYLEEGQSPEDVLCSCKSNKSSDSYMDLNSNSGNSQKNGCCGGNCGTH